MANMTMPDNQSHEATRESAEPGEITFAELLEILRGSWVLVVAFLLLGVAIAATIAWTMTPVYRASVLVVPAGTDEGAGGGALSRLAGQIAPLAGLVAGGGANGLEGKEVWIATLKSRSVADQFIKGHDLLPVLFPDRWDADARRWKVRGSESLAPTMDEAYEVFSDDVLSVSEDRRTGLVTVAIEATDPNSAAIWANDLVSEVNEVIRSRAIAEAQQSLTYLEREIERTKVAELQKVLYGMIESRIAKSMLANVRKEYAFAVVDPAVASDPANYVRPRRAVYAVVGALLGSFVGLIAGLLRWAGRKKAIGQVGQ